MAALPIPKPQSMMVFCADPPNMRRKVRAGRLGTLAAFLLCISAHTNGQAQEATQATDDRLPGVSVAEGVSQITGVAVSPLLGVSAIGAWKYVNTPENQRHLLPWYCAPWAWGTGLALLSLCFLKDFLGAAAPPLVKKPLDYAELFENKASALVASTAFIPLVASAMVQVDAIQPKVASASMASLGLATIQILPDTSWLKLMIYTPLALVCFAIVWIACHAINVLIALSPFGIVDAGLKLIKLAILGIITGAALIHPTLGLVVCIPFILAAAWFAGPAFRLTVFGTVFGWDLLSCRKATPEEVKAGVKTFNAVRLPKTPPRSYGTLSHDGQGCLVFHYRPYLCLPLRSVIVDSPPDTLCSGVIHPSLTHTDGNGRTRNIFTLLPRYKSCLPSVSARLGIENTSDSSLMRGLKAMRNWLVEALSIGRKLIEPPRSGEIQKAQ